MFLFSRILSSIIVSLFYMSNILAAPIHDAIKSGNTEELVEILDKDPESVDLQDECGLSPVHLAVIGRIQELQTDTLLNRVLGKSKNTYQSILRLLLDKKANLNLGPFTVLHSAVQYGNIGLINKLLDGGANPNKKDTTGTTPLHLAILKFKESDLDESMLIVHKLFCSGGDPGIEMSDGKNGFDLAASSPELFKLLFGGSVGKFSQLENTLRTSIYRDMLRNLYEISKSERLARAKILEMQLYSQESTTRAAIDEEESSSYSDLCKASILDVEVSKFEFINPVPE